MNKTRLSFITALTLLLLSFAVHASRRLGAFPQSRDASSRWKIAMMVGGDLTAKGATLTISRPPDFRHQHILDENWQSNELLVPRGKKQSKREEVILRSRGHSTPQTFELVYSFQCRFPLRKPTPAMVQVTRTVDRPPEGDMCLQPSSRIESDHKEVKQKAESLTAPQMSSEEQIRVLFDYAAGLDNEPSFQSPDALRTLRSGSGDSTGKSCLLIALCRNRGIPARLMHGLLMGALEEQKLHRWVEAWVNNLWFPMCPTYEHFGPSQIPKSYFVVRVGDEEPIRHNGARLQSRFVVQSVRASPAQVTTNRSIANLFQKLSLQALKPGEQHIIKFLLLLPLAALIVSIFRTFIGVPTFGTFSPALIGLAFLDLKALPWGLGIFIFTILVGWLARRVLDRYHLLSVPRTGILLTFIVLFLIVVIVVANQREVPVTHYISLFPLVILTHLVERFWTVEAEDGTAASFKTLAGTLVVAVTISAVLSPMEVTSWMFHYPETIGVVLAAQFLIGRYTGYRISELYRFHDLLGERAPGAQS